MALHRRPLRQASGVEVRLCRNLAWYFEHLHAKGSALAHVRNASAPPWLEAAAEAFLETGDVRSLGSPAASRVHPGGG